MVIVMGTVRVPVENLGAILHAMERVVTATRAEDGCIAYSYAEDVAEPGLIRVFEAWRDQAALDAHFQTPHMATWRSHWPAYGVSDRQLSAYDVAAERPL